MRTLDITSTQLFMCTNRRIILGETKVALVMRCPWLTRIKPVLHTTRVNLHLLIVLQRHNLYVRKVRGLKHYSRFKLQWDCTAFLLFYETESRKKTYHQNNFCKMYKVPVITQPSKIVCLIYFSYTQNYFISICLKVFVSLGCTFYLVLYN